MANLPITQIPANPSNFAVGRGACSPLAIYLHQTALSMTQLDASACRKRKAGSVGASYHFGVDGAIVHQYVDIADTAFSFGSSAAVPPVPGKPVSCTDDQSTINIAISTPPMYADSNMDNCPTPIAYPLSLQQSLAKLLCMLSKETGMTLSDATVLLNVSELPDFPLADVLALAAVCMEPLPLVPVCECAANLCQLPVAADTDAISGFAITVDAAGTCYSKILNAVPPVSACSDTPQAVALTPVGWKPVRQSWRVAEMTATGIVNPDDVDIVVATVAGINVVVANPTCATSNIEIKNGTNGVVTVLFANANLNGGASFITLNGSNALGTGDGESVELAFVSGKFYSH